MKGKRRKKVSKTVSVKKKITQFETIQPNVAGIDVSDNSGMMVAYPINDTDIVVEEFGCYTEDLRQLASTLKLHGIKGAAIESTGVYWIPLFIILQEEGIEVSLVNARHVKNVTGRKTDEEDSVWLQKLHRCGLLSTSFQPNNQTRNLRIIVRHRKMLVQNRSSFLNRIQKALEGMNIKLHTIISDIDGKTGLDIIEAIIGGERNPGKLADLRDRRIKASREELVKSLTGIWSEEHLFELKQCYRMYQSLNEMIYDCDLRIASLLKSEVISKNGGVMPELGKLKNPEQSPKTRKQKQQKPLKNPKRPVNQDKNTMFDDKYLQSLLVELNGIDMTTLPGINTLGAATIRSEIGDDIKKFKNPENFASWVGVVPNTKTSAGNVISSHVPKTKNRVGQVFRMAAVGLLSYKGPLGDYARHMHSSLGPYKGIVAIAHKLVIIYYNMMIYQMEYNPDILNQYQKKHKEEKIKRMEKALTKLKVAM
jgi:transposase